MTVSSLTTAYQMQLLVMSRINLFDRRRDLTESFNKLQCKTLIFVGDSSPFHSESLYMSAKMDKKSCALVEVRFFSIMSSFFIILSLD